MNKSELLKVLNDKECTKEDLMLMLMNELPRNKYRTEAFNAIIRCLNYEIKINNNNTAEINIKNILLNTINNEKAILKETDSRIILDKKIVFNTFAKFGIKKYELINELKKMDLIPEEVKHYEFAPVSKINGKSTRVIILNKNKLL